MKASETRGKTEESRCRGSSNPSATKSVGDRVLVPCQWGGRGKVSGIETYIEVYCLATVRFGAVSRMEYYFDKSEALEALGLRE
jgi:hypothetical protein